MASVVQGECNMEGITQESVDSMVKQRRKQRSIFYRWWLMRQIKKCQKQVNNINDPLEAAKILIQQKKYVDELTYVNVMRFNKN